MSVGLGAETKVQMSLMYLVLKSTERTGSNTFNIEVQANH